MTDHLARAALPFNPDSATNPLISLKFELMIHPKLPGTDSSLCSPKYG